VTFSETAGPYRYPAGVFSLTPADQAPNPSVLTNPSIGGVVIPVKWDEAEPQQGVLSSTYLAFLDQQLQAAQSAGKMVSFLVEAARHSDTYLGPLWLQSLGVSSMVYIDSNPNHSNFGKPVTLPLPWDPTYVSSLVQFISLLGSRYGTSSAITYVNGSTELVTNGWGLPAKDQNGASIATYGYKPERLITTMQTVLDAFMAAFPGKSEWAEVGANSFELAVSGNAPDYTGQQIANYGFGKYPLTFGVWREDLSGCISLQPTNFWQILQQHPGRDGSQMLWNVQDGPTRMNQCGITPNTKDVVLQAAIQRGVTYGMPYVEVYELDCIDPACAAALQFGAQNLQSSN
jgi:hypothetical protein